MFAQTSEAPAEIIEPIPAERVIMEADTALRTLQGIEANLQSDTVISSGLEKLADLKTRLKPFYKQSSEILEANPSLDRLQSLNKAWTEESASLAQWKTLLTTRSKELADQGSQLTRISGIWQKTRPNLPPSPPELILRAKSVLTLADSIRPKLLERQKEMLSVESKLAEQEIAIRDMLTAVEQATGLARTNLFVQDTFPIWSPEFRSGMAHGLEDSGESWSGQSALLKPYLASQVQKIMMQLVLVTVLIVGLFAARRKMREWAGNDPELKTAFQIFETPIASAFLVTLGVSSWFYPYAPNLWKGFMGAFLLIPTVIILHRLVERRLYPVLNALVFFYFLDQFRLLSSDQPGVLRAAFLFESLSAILFLTWTLLSFRKKEIGETSHLTRTVQIGGRIALVFTSMALLSNLTGYDRLGTLLLNGVLRSCYLAVILYAGVHLVQALILAFFKTPFMSRLGVVREYRPLLRRRIFGFLNWGTFFCWLALSLEMFSLRDPVFTKLESLLLAKHSLGSLDFSLANLFAFGLTIWVAFLISRLVRFILDHDVYPRFSLSQGLPYAISNVIHYSILLLAFFMATAALGIDMTKFTILVSAFGVGIGFGLQNIINNFVSGLILLFERPIKIGDSVQVGDAIGTVSRIGIRASVLRTNNGSEIIVPNATLISTNVTNWTLSNQRRIIVLPLNVAQGPDPDRVSEILKREALANESVLKDPAPEVLIISLAATMSFELRVWTSEVENWPNIRSDLFTATNQALAKEGIKPA